MTKPCFQSVLTLIIVLHFTGLGLTKTYSKDLPVYLDNNKNLAYTPDSLGNRVPDFSYAGYKAGEQKIPNVQVKIFIPAQDRDASGTIQKAIDYIANLEPDKNGFRGAILLDKGEFILSKRLIIKNSGIVLRGSGTGDNGTTLIANGLDRETLIKIMGTNNRIVLDEKNISNNYVPVNSLTFEVDNINGLKAGDNIIIQRPSTKEWIDVLNANEFGGDKGWIGWKPGRRDLFWDVKITKIEGTQVTYDSPITTSLDNNYGGGKMYKYNWPGRIQDIGIENMNLVSAYDKKNKKDENHCWMAIIIENAMDVWIRQVNFKHFAGSAVTILETAKKITVEDCISEAPVSEIGGERRYTFYTCGQQTLFQRCYAEYGYHDFSVGYTASGPNAFVQCESYLSYSYSGAIDCWASGALFDIVNVDGQALSVKNQETAGQGAGWTGANCMLWQCSASRIDCYAPPMAQNWAFGTWGIFYGNGYWYEASSHIQPRSLYCKQLNERTGIDISSNLLPVSTEATSSPTVEEALKYIQNSVVPPVQLKDWIKKAPERNPVSTYHSKVPSIEKVKIEKQVTETGIKNKVSISNGWIINNNGIITGSRLRNQWWRGNIRPYVVSRSSPHITRFVPGREGTGFTDNLDSVVSFMKQNDISAFDHNYGLWYERRRDDHERVRRMNGDVCPPFYELPYSRSGEELAWDGLSKYDLTKFNPWYWSRLEEFATKAEYEGKILIHQNYFQHNILEAGAHWADFPWRTANNINNTGFPEPPPYAGDKRIFMAEQFYDISHPTRKELHKLFIKKCLDNFADNNNVIQMIGEEFTGPLHFVEFWIDVIMEWEKETGKNVFIALSTTKDVQDAILIDPIRSSVIDIIDIKYWHYRDDGSVYAPEGGKNMAPRQFARKTKKGKSDFEAIYKAVSEYKNKYPQKAVMYSSNGYMQNEWAVFMAGGSLSAIPQVEVEGFLQNVSTMKPSVLEKNIKSLTNSNGEYILYLDNKNSLRIPLDKGNFNIYYFNTKDGTLIKKEEKIKGENTVEIMPADETTNVIWIKRN